MKLLVNILYFSCILTAFHLSALGQPGAGDPAIVQHYAASERIPNAINDFVFDGHGLLWISPENDNIRLFDGTNVRVLETPFAKGIPQFEFSRVLKDRNGSPCFISIYHEFLFRLNEKGELSEEPKLTGEAHHIYNNGEFFFDWDRFISLGGDLAGQKARERLRKRTGENTTFAAFDDSTFSFKESDSMFVYRRGRLTRIDMAGVDSSRVFSLDHHIFILGPGGFVRLGDSTGSLKRTAITGDLLHDSLFRLRPAVGSLRLYRSEFSHIRCGNRLYRLLYLNDTLLSTVLVTDIGFIQSRINKVEYEPRGGVTAIATAGEGLYILKPNPFYSRRFDDQFQGLKKKMIYYPLAITPQDSFLTPWCRFSGDGSYRLLDLHHDGGRALFADWAGNVWEGVKDKIVRYDESMVKQSEQMLPLPSTKTVDFCEALPGQLFCLTEHSILKCRTGHFVDLSPVAEKLAGDIRFQQMRYIGNGIYWLAANKGIYRYDQGDNTLNRVEGIPDVFTLNIARLSGGSILVTCYPESFYYLYYKEKFYKIPVESDLPLKETSSILEDGKGRIWFATSSGFFVTTEKEIEAWCDGQTRSIYYYRYGKDEGLLDLEFNGGLNRSNGMTTDGYMAFNSMGGVIVFHQDSIREVFPVGPIQLAKRGALGEEYSAGDSIQLPHDNEGMVVQVRIPYFGSRDNLRIEYCLDPGAPEWREVDPQGRINLQHLVHGTYILSVRVRTGLLPGQYRIRRVAVVVPYLFYESPVFRVIAVVVVILICVFVTNAIVRLRKEVRIKNLRLHDQNLELQSTLGELRDNMALKEKLISLVLHDLKTPLYFQSLLFNQIVESDYFKDEEAHKLFHDLKMSSAAILQFTKEFLTWYSSQREGFQVRNTAFNHRLIVDDLFSVYGDIARRKNLKLHYNTRSLHTLYTDRNILEIIIRNLLDNAIKYTDKGSVRLIFERKLGMDSIIVSDTGSGMGIAKIKQLEQYALKSGEQSSPTFGYRFIYTMAEKIGAHIRITSAPGQGTCVTIVLPQIVEEPVVAEGVGG